MNCSMLFLIVLVLRQWWFWKWLRVVSQQTISWRSVDPNVQCHMEPLLLSRIKFNPSMDKEWQAL